MNRRLAILACAAALLGFAAPAGASQPKAQKSIIGGRAADPVAWGFSAAILDRGRFICSGSVIGPTSVLTAAHCIIDDASQLAVITGRTRIGDPSGGQVLAVSAAAVHPDWQTTATHDLAVLTLATPTTATPVKLPTAEEDSTYIQRGARVSIAGFGARNPLAGKPRLGVLRQTPVLVAPQRYCRGRGPRRRFTLSTMTCLLGHQIRKSILGRSVCAGDSGGPMAARLPTDGLPRVFGVASYGAGGRGFLGFIGCGLFGLSVYARVSSGLDFITANIPAPVTP